MIITEAILMGIFATLLMDLSAKILIKRKIIHSFIRPETIGRWFLYLLKGKFRHKDIRQSTVLNNEMFWTHFSHYLIGIVLAGIYLLLEMRFTSKGYQFWMPLAFGIITVVLPWFWMFPSMGLGFIASKLPNPPRIIRTNLINHTSFGIGLLIWNVSFHRLLT